MNTIWKHNSISLLKKKKEWNFLIHNSRIEIAVIILAYIFPLCGWFYIYMDFILFYCKKIEEERVRTSNNQWAEL